MSPAVDQVLARMQAAAMLPPREFIENHLFTATPFAFRTNLADYDVFRNELAERLAVQEDALQLVGSGRLGFSLNAAHLLRRFQPSSDLDVVVISSPIFDQAWSELVELETSIGLADEDERRKLKRTKENFFQGYLRPDYLPISCQLTRDWFPKLSARFQSTVASRHEVRAWLFKSLTHTSALYSSHLGRVQPAIRKLLHSRGDL